jgi:hypothetical protein
VLKGIETKKQLQKQKKFTKVSHSSMHLLVLDGKFARRASVKHIKGCKIFQ